MNGAGVFTNPFISYGADDLELPPGFQFKHIWEGEIHDVIGNEADSQDGWLKIQMLPPWKLTYPLKNDGWKMHFLLK